MTAIPLAAALLMAQPAPSPRLLTLEDAVREAQAQSSDLKALRARLDQSRTLGWQAWSAYLPQITAGGTYTHNSAGASIPVGIGNVFIQDTGAVRTPPPSVPGTPTPFAIQYGGGVRDVTIQQQDQLGAQVNLSQALIAPGLWFGISSARLGETFSAQTVESARRDLLFAVVQLYHGAVGVKYAVRITEKQLAIALGHEKDARVRYQAGSTARVALLRAEIDRAKAEQDLRAAQAGYDSARVALATALGRPDSAFDVEVPAAPPAPPAADELEAAAVKERPDVLAAGTSLQIAETGRDGIRSRYLPTLGAFGRWQWANLGGFTGQKDSWAVGLALSWTLLDGTLREAQLRESEGKIAEARENLRSAEARALGEVRRARLDLEAAVANSQKARETAELARENQRLVEVNYKAGAATYLEVADANNQLLSAEISNVTEDVKARLAALALLKAAGRFDPR
jgi:outer membrane protein TolC